jgi:hypothetical protein
MAMASAGHKLPETVSRTASLMVVCIVLTGVALECSDSIESARAPGFSRGDGLSQHPSGRPG